MPPRTCALGRPITGDKMAEPWNIRRRKAVEDQFARASAMLADRREVSKMVEFEHRSDAAIQRRLVKERASRTKAQMEADLRSRKAR